MTLLQTTAVILKTESWWLRLNRESQWAADANSNKNGWRKWEAWKVIVCPDIQVPPCSSSLQLTHGSGTCVCCILTLGNLWEMFSPHNLSSTLVWKKHICVRKLFCSNHHLEFLSQTSLFLSFIPSQLKITLTCQRGWGDYRMWTLLSSATVEPIETLVPWHA